MFTNKILIIEKIFLFAETFQETAEQASQQPNTTWYYKCL